VPFPLTPWRTVRIRKEKNAGTGVKKKQAAKVNKMQKKKANAGEFKDPLDIGDICAISTDDFKKKYIPYLPVLITGVTQG
jgi:hypothetical protein